MDPFVINPGDPSGRPEIATERLFYLLPQTGYSPLVRSRIPGLEKACHAAKACRGMAGNKVLGALMEQAPRKL